MQDPLILGHEFSAEIVEVGPGVDDPAIRPGALASVEPMWTCGQCAPCRRGRTTSAGTWCGTACRRRAAGCPR
ncbi:alcohol dehydrogenase catalytic domain-containing protein [Yinghuangia aomiensis]